LPNCLGDANHFILPQLHADLCTDSVLAMTRMHGLPVESLANASHAERDRRDRLAVATAVPRNIRIWPGQPTRISPTTATDSDSRQLILLDFGRDTRLPGDDYRELSATSCAAHRWRSPQHG